MPKSHASVLQLAFTQLKESMTKTLNSYFEPKTATKSPDAAIAKVPDATETEKVDVEAQDTEQEFIDYFAKVAKNPMLNGRVTSCRKVAVFGKRYYWKGDVTFDINKLPLSFRKWCAKRRYTGHNSVVVNVYKDSKDNIGWHSDDTSKLADGEVVSISFALNKQDRTQKLAAMEFMWHNKEDSARVVKSSDLKHETVVRFDAIKHKKKGCKHRVQETFAARVNVTMRTLK